MGARERGLGEFDPIGLLPLDLTKLARGFDFFTFGVPPNFFIAIFFQLPVKMKMMDVKISPLMVKMVERKIQMKEISGCQQNSGEKTSIEVRRK